MKEKTLEEREISENKSENNPEMNEENIRKLRSIFPRKI